MNQPPSCLYITNAYDAKKNGAAASWCRTQPTHPRGAEIRRAARRIRNRPAHSSPLPAANTLSGRTDGGSRHARFREIAALAHRTRPDCVFFNGSIRSDLPAHRETLPRGAQYRSITFATTSRANSSRTPTPTAARSKSWLLSRLYARSERMVLRRPAAPWWYASTNVTGSFSPRSTAGGPKMDAPRA